MEQVSSYGLWGVEGEPSYFCFIYLKHLTSASHTLFCALSYCVFKVQCLNKIKTIKKESNKHNLK